MTDGSDEPCGLLALLTAVLFACISKQQSKEIPWLACVPLATYGILFGALPALVKAMLAVLTLTLLLSHQFFGKKIHLGLLGLLLLSLPLIASLQFYAGFPIRVLTTKIVAQLIGISGEPVAAAGTSLLWRGDIISIDAPCSGIKMLWGGLFVAFTLSCFGKLNNFQTWLAYFSSSLIIFAANVCRAYILFFTESKLVWAPSWFHPFAGVFFFALATLSIVFMNSFIRRNYATCRFYMPCRARPS
jgi:exosortase/archaeosortase family protein